MKKFAAAGARIILWTMRSHTDSTDPNVLTDAVQWFYQRGISLHGVNENPDQYVWTSSRKAYAQIYIDDAAAGCPLKQNRRKTGRPYVDWGKVGPLVMKEIRNQGEYEQWAIKNCKLPTEKRKSR
jgi:hypothetical protein